MDTKSLSERDICTKFSLARRERLDEATARADVEGLARKLLRPSGPRTEPVLKKKTGLDEGVSLP